MKNTHLHAAPVDTSKRSIATGAWSVALALALPLLSGSLAMASGPGKFERTLNVTGPVSLDISSGPGGVSITTGTSRTVVVRAVIRAAFGRADLGLAEANIQALEQNPPVEQNGNSIRVGYVKNDAILRGVSVTYEIQVPQDTQVQASADAGGIHIDGVQGPVELKNDAGLSEVANVKGSVKMTTRAGSIMVRNAGTATSLRNESGSIQLDGAFGPVDAETKNGRIELSNVSGKVNATTQSASIRLHDISGDVVARNHSGSIESFASGGGVQATTDSGSIRISQTSPAPIHAISSSGAIRVGLAPGKGYNLNLRSEKGKISGTNFAKVKDQHTVNTQILGGGPIVDVETRSSKIEFQ
jgi:DUF4097 and DUF4098 domain-containing protein YvlB